LLVAPDEIRGNKKHPFSEPRMGFNANKIMHCECFSADVGVFTNIDYTRLIK